MRQLWNDITGGIIGSLMVVPIILSCGVVSYQSLGSQFVSTGIVAAFVSAFFAALFAGLFGYPPLHGNCPKTSHAAILSSLIAIIATHHSFTTSFTGSAAPQALMTICIITLAISGLTQLLIGRAGLGSIVKFIPYPVLAGFINGFALQIIIGQIPSLLAASSFKELALILTGKQFFNPYPLYLALFSCLAAYGIAKINKLIPTALSGLIIGTLVYLVLKNYTNLHISFGSVIGHLPDGNYFIPQFHNIFHVVDSDAFLKHWFLILTTGITLALISSIQSLLSISTADELFETRHNSNKELMVQGGANLFSALFGGSPNGGSANITQSMYSSGGRTRYANLTSALVLLLLPFGLANLIQHIPLSVMAGVVIVNTAGAMDKWTQQLLKKVNFRHDTHANRDTSAHLTVVVLVTLLVVTKGALLALGVGMALSFWIFLYQAKDRTVRKILHLDQLRSRIDRPAVEYNMLMAHSHRVAIFELQGSLFFGAVESLSQLIEAEMATADWIILNFRRNSLVDASGAIALKKLNNRMNKAHKKLLLAHLPVDSKIRQDLSELNIEQLATKGNVFDDLNAALVMAETELLSHLNYAKQTTENLGLAQFELLANMQENELAVLNSYLEVRHFSAGALVIKADSQNQSVFFLANGQASVRSTAKGKSLHLTTYQPGVIFGEMAFFTGRNRSANIVTDTPSTLFELSHQAFERLCLEHPYLSIKLLRGLGSGLANHLVLTTQIVHELES